MSHKQIFAVLLSLLLPFAGAEAQTISKTLNVQGVLKTSGGSLVAGTYGMRFTFKKNGASFPTPCQVVKNSVVVTAGAFNAAVDTSSCNLANQISSSVAATITVDVELDMTGATFSSATSTFSGLTVSPVAMSLVAEKANGLATSGTTGQVLTYDGSNWSAGYVDSNSFAPASIDLSASPALAGVLPVTMGGTGTNSLSGLRSGIGAAASGANSDITSLTGLTTPLSVSRGGTGSNSVSGARTALGVAASGSNSDITSLNGLTTPLSVAQGGTGTNSLSGMRAAISAAGSGANSDITSITGLTTPLSVAQGGTGANTLSGMRAAISAAASGANSDITSITGLTTPLSVAQGGTGTNSLSSLRTAISAASNGVNTDITSITGTAQVANSQATPTTAGTTTAYTLALSPFSRVTGSNILFFVNATNTGSATLNVNSTGAATMISAFTGANLAAGDLPTGRVVSAVYNGTNWVVSIPPLFISASSVSCGSSVSANSSTVCTAFTATNVNTGDWVSCSPSADPASTAGQVNWNALALDEQITIRLGCNRTSSCAITSRNWRCLVQK